jgi:hypothetical protein
MSRDYPSLLAPCYIFIDLPDLNHRFLVPLHLMSIFTEYIVCAILHCYYWYPELFAFLTTWRGMAGPSVWWNVDGFDHSNFWEVRDVDISISLKKIKKMLPGNYSKHLVVYIRNINVFPFSMSRNYTSLQAPCQIFVRHLARVIWLIRRSLASDICADWIHIMCHNVLLRVIFAVFHVLDSIMSYDRSKYATRLKEFECPNF